MRSDWTNRVARRLPLLALLGIAIIGFLTLPRYGSLDDYLRHMISWEGSRALGRPLRIERSQLAYLPATQTEPARLQVHLINTVIEPPARAAREAREPLVQIPDLYVAIRWGSLLSGDLLGGARLIRAVNPAAYIIRDRAGQWNFADLLKRPAKPGKPFTGRLEVVGGTLFFYDYTPPAGLLIPQRNRLTNLQVSVGASADQMQFRLQGTSPERRIGAVSAAGRSLKRPGGSQLSSTVQVSDADISYLWRYRALTSKVHFSAGRADVEGYFVVGRSADKISSLDYSVVASGNQVQLTLPWVKGLIQQAQGTVRISNGLVQLSSVQANLGATRVKGGGYMETALIKNLPKATAPKPAKAGPGQGYAFHFSSNNATGAEIARRMPTALGQNLAGLQGPSRFGVNLTGRGKAIALYGTITTPDWQLERTLAGNSGTLPQVARTALANVRGLTGGFIYSPQAFSAAATGNVLGGHAQGACYLPATGRAGFSATLANAALPPTKMIGESALSGQAWANLQGSFAARGSRGTVIAGNAVLVSGALHTTVDSQVAHFPFTSLTSDFALAPGTTLFPNATADTGYGLFSFTGGLLPGGMLTGQLEGGNINLQQVGKVLGQSASGTSFVSARLAGTAARPDITLRADAFGGDLRGYRYDWLGGEGQLQGRTVPRFTAVLQRGAGEARLAGRAVLPSGANPGLLAATGSAEGVRLDEWLPASLLAQGIASAKLDVAGTVRAPAVTADFQVSRPAVRGVQFDSAEGALRYHNGGMTLTNLVAQATDAQLSASGQLQRDGKLDFSFLTERLHLASLISPNSKAQVDGWLTMQGRIWGSQDNPLADLSLRADDIKLAGRPAGDLTANLAWRGDTLNVNNLDFTGAAQGGRLHLAGDISRATRNAAWDSRLQVEASGLRLPLMLDIVQQGARLVDSEPVRNRIYSLLAKVPRPLNGFLTASATLFGPLAAPSGKADFTVSEAALAGQHLPSLEGQVSLAGQKINVQSLVAREGEANATASGTIDLAGDTNLNIDVHNLEAQVLRPWIPSFSRVGGSADIYLQFMGPTHQPTIQGSIEVADPVIGDVHLERLRVDHFLVTDNQIDIDTLRVVKGPHLASLSASVPFSWTSTLLHQDAPFWLEAKLDNQDLSFVNALWPTIGELAGPLNASLRIAGTPTQPRLESGFVRAVGTWNKAPLHTNLSLNSQVVNGALQLGSATQPGLAVSVARSENGQVTSRGGLTGRGSYDPFAGPQNRWGLGRYDVALTANNFDVNLAKLLKGRLDGNLYLVGDPTAAQTDQITGDVQLSKVTFALPSAAPGGAISWRPSFSPALDVKVQVKDLNVSTTMARFQFAGEGTIGGHLGYEPLAVNLALHSKQGKIQFPVAVADVKNLEVAVTKAPEESLVARGKLDATSRVGRYRVTLTGGGSLYPESNLKITANTSPPTSEQQATALLLGFPPGLLGTQGLTPEEAVGSRVAQSLATNVTSLAAAGFTAPLLRAMGLNELSFAISPLSSQLTLGKRFADRIYLYYLSSLSGTHRSSLIRTTVDVTPNISIGVSINELQQKRLEIEHGIAF